MSNQKRCICAGRPLHELVPAFAIRAKAVLVADMGAGKRADFQRLALTAQLVKALSERKAWAFSARFDSYDHHLVDCPCSSRFVAPAG